MIKWDMRVESGTRGLGTNKRINEIQSKSEIF